MFKAGRQFIFIALVSILLGSSTVLFAGDDWREVTQAELQMKTPKVEADADAEAIFWEVRIDDTTADLVMKHYIRVKIFTENGREKYSKVDIPFLNKRMKIKDIEARVIRPDGSIVLINKNDIFEREIVKDGDVKIKAMSFAIPNVEPGVIVEYRYREIQKSTWASNMRMFFQHDIPIQNISYYFKPYQFARYFTFNMEDTKFVKDKGGYFRATLENVPALKDESRMPPEDEVRSWLLLYYTNDKNTDAMNVWSRISGAIVEVFDVKKILKPGKTLVSAAEQITAGATSPEDKIAKVFEFCKTKVRNIDYDTSLTDEQKEEIKANKNTEDTYKKMQGTSTEINELFASLTDGLGFETRIAFGGNRSEKFFNISQAHVSFVHFTGIAVKVNGEWKYYDPGSYFVPYGMISWFEEDTDVLLLGYKDFITTHTPFSGYEKSAAKRTGKFKLLEDGTLEGTVRIEYTGHLSTLHKTNNYDESANQREENLKKEIQGQMTTAELSNISIENVSDPEKPFTYQFKVRVPNYAQRTGKRLFFQPGFFENGKKAEFASATRKYPIFFRYPWSEVDNIEIELPKGFELDNAERPSPVADPQNIGALDVKISIDKTSNILLYNRNFHFGGGGNVLFSTANYQPLKNLWDLFHEADSKQITLKQTQ